MISNRIQNKAQALQRMILHTLAIGVVAIFVGACGGEPESLATRTPVPTWTPTPSEADLNSPPASDTSATETSGAQTDPLQTDTPTAAPVDTPLVEPAETPTPDAQPTATEVVEPTPTAAFLFELKTAEKFPTESLAPNMVRVYLYVSDEGQFGLAGYKLLVMHDDKQLVVDTISESGLPKVTSAVPSPFSRFTNLNAVFVESQSGRWTVQLLDANNSPVGPPALFNLTADEVTRELYVRYQLK